MSQERKEKMFTLIKHHGWYPNADLVAAGCEIPAHYGDLEIIVELKNEEEVRIFVHPDLTYTVTHSRFGPSGSPPAAGHHRKESVT